MASLVCSKCKAPAWGKNYINGRPRHLYCRICGRQDRRDDAFEKAGKYQPGWGQPPRFIYQ